MNEKDKERIQINNITNFIVKRNIKKNEINREIIITIIIENENENINIEIIINDNEK